MPAAIYRERAAGVVTILALFGPNDSVAAAEAAQGSGFVVSSDGYILTNSHVITTAGEGDPTATPEAANTVFVEFRDGDRVRARIVGWDIYDDVGLLKVDPADHHLTVGAARRLRARRRRPARRGDRKPVRQRELAERRGRVGDRALDRLA